MPARKKSTIAELPEFDEKAIDLLLSTASSEYELENGRIANHDAKMNIMLPTSIAYFLAIITMSDLIQLLSFTTESVAEAIIPVGALLSDVVGIIASVFAIVIMLRALLPKEYIAINTEDFYNLAYLDGANRKVFKLHLYRRYIDATSHNRELNNQRMKQHKRACVCMIVSILAVVVYNIIEVLIFKGA